MQLNNIRSFTTAYSDYQKANIEYNMEALKKELKLFAPGVPLDQISLNDPKFKPILQKMPMCPKVMGGLSKTLGVDASFVTLELWDNLFHSWCPADKLPADSPLQQYVEDTPRGRMIKLNANATPMAPDGEWMKQPKEHRAGNEMLFTLGKGLSTYITAKAADDPTFLTRVNEMKERVMKQYIIPQVTEDARVKMGEGGVILKQGMEVMCVDFMHIDNRPSENEKPGKKRSKLQKAEEGTVPEPHIHWHTFFLNSCLGADGKLHALTTDDIYPNKKYLSMLFMARMKEAFEQEFGLVMEPVYARGDETKPEDERTIITYDIASDLVSEDVKNAFSKRSIKMKQSIKSKGLDVSTGAMEVAQVSLKQKKNEMSPSEMLAAWKEQYLAMGFDVKELDAKLDYEQMKPEFPSYDYDRVVMNMHIHNFGQRMEKVDNAFKRIRKTADAKPKEHNAPTDEAIIAAFHRDHKEYSFTESQFIAYVATQFLAQMEPYEAEKEARRLFRQEALIHMEPENLRKYLDFFAGKVSNEEREQYELRYMRDVKFTSKYMHKMATGITEGLNARANETSFVLDKDFVTDCILKEELRMTELIRAKNPDAPPFRLEARQREAAINSTTQNGACALIQGPPGTGKSTVCKAIVDAYKEKGFELIATSISSAATQNLAKDTGITAQQTANTTELLMQLDAGKRVLTNKSVIVFDEAGMGGVETNSRLLDHIHKAGAKVIYVGDHHQVQPVEAGGVFQHLVNRFPTVTLEAINRHRLDAHKQMSKDLGAGKARKALREAYDRGEIIITDTAEQAKERLVMDYLADPLSQKDKKAIAGFNEDVDSVNLLVREALKNIGKLSGRPEDEVEVECKDGVLRTFTPGERIIFDTNMKSDDVKGKQRKVLNSQAGTVERLIRSTITGKVTAMSVVMDNNPQPITIDLAKRNPPLRGAAMQTVHKSQGATYENTYSYVSPSRHSLNEIYVQFTRHKGQHKIYLSKESMDKIIQESAELPPSKKQQDTVKWLARKNNLELPPEALLTFGGARAFLNEHYITMEGVKHHPMDDFNDLLDSISQLSLKKSAQDYELLEGTHWELYDEIRQGMKAELKAWNIEKREAKLSKLTLPIPLPEKQAPELKKGKDKKTELTM
ncbi:exonuclease V subunit alpha [Caballeronia peredens]|nr:exonuclease V subunit alpha [Caballeronia peredens]